MSKRAARGSGLSWGLAEEAAKGVRWLSSFGFPGGQLLADLLEMNDRVPSIDVAPVSLDGVWRAPIGRLSPLICGASMSDCAVRMEKGEVISMAHVNLPLLVVPFAGGAALRLGVPVTVAWDGVEATTDGRHLCVEGERDAVLARSAEHVRCHAPGKMASESESVMRCSVDATSWARLTDFAARTYAPSTEASRLLGAGAGLNDND